MYLYPLQRIQPEKQQLKKPEVAKATARGDYKQRPETILPYTPPLIASRKSNFTLVILRISRSHMTSRRVARTCLTRRLSARHAMCDYCLAERSSALPDCQGGAERRHSCGRCGRSAQSAVYNERVWISGLNSSCLYAISCEKFVANCLYVLYIAKR